MSPSLNEESVEHQEALERQPASAAGAFFLHDPVGGILDDDGLEAVQSPAFKVHVETPTLEEAKLAIRKNAVIVLVADLEHTTQRFFALLRKLKKEKN